MKTKRIPLVCISFILASLSIITLFLASTNNQMKQTVALAKSADLSAQTSSIIPISIQSSVPITQAFVAISYPNSVAVIDTTDNTIIEDGIAWPIQPGVGAITPDRTLLYIAGGGDGSIYGMDTRGYTIVSTITIEGNDQRGIAISSNGSRMYVADNFYQRVTVIDLQSGSVVSPIDLVSHPEEIVLSPDGSRLYVAGNTPDENYVIDTASNTIIDTFQAGSNPHGISTSQDGQYIFVSNFDSGDVSVIASADLSLVTNILAGSGAHKNIMTPDRSKLYVLNLYGFSISVIDPINFNAIGTIPMAAMPKGGATTQDGSKLYVALDNGTVVVIDVLTDTVVDSIPVGGNVQNVFIRPLLLPSWYMIQGHVSDISGNPIEDVLITVNSEDSTTTNTLGNFTISELVTGTYTVTPTKANYSFSPMSQVVSIPPDATGVDFVGTLLMPPSGLSVAGPIQGLVGESYTFTATVNPITTTLPITYVWRASQQTPITNTNGITDDATFTWHITGSRYITVTASNSLQVVTATHSISLFEPCQADFVADPKQGIAPLEVAFTNMSTGDFNSSLWDFGDGVTSVLTDPMHIYTSEGNFTVKLTVDGLGGSDIEIKEGLIIVTENSSQGYKIYTPVVYHDYQPSSLNWQGKCVDCPRAIHAMGHGSMKYKSSGNPAIAYGGDYLYYAWHDGSQWHTETVDNSPGAGTHTALFFDTNDYAHIAYSDSDSSELKYAYQDAGGWNIQTVEGGLGAGYVSLALDQNNYAHISYFESTNRDLKYAYQDDSGWHISTLDSDGSVGWYSSLGLDNSGYAHISYSSNYPDEALKYTYQDASGWNTETFEQGSTVRYSSLALDQNGYPHIAYDADWGSLKHAYKDASGWHTETATTFPEGSDDISLVLDNAGYAYISFYAPNYNYNRLGYAYQDAGGWHVETIDSQGIAGLYTSIALGPGGYPGISYSGDGNLKFAHKDATGWHTEPVDPGGIFGIDNSIAVDTSGYPHISYKGIGGFLKYAHQDASGWNTELIEQELYGAIEWTSLDLDSSNYPHISYFDYKMWGSSILKYAYKDASGWHIQAVDSTLDQDGGYTSIELDINGLPRISYYNDSTDSLMYAAYNGSSWQLETVDSGLGYWMGFSSLEFDGNGYPHIAYYHYDSGDLKYAYKDSGGWHVSTVDSGGDVGASPSLALDAGGYPHISYLDVTNSTLKYAYQDASGWHLDVADSAESLWYATTSIDLDSTGNPHISYYDAAARELRYAYHDASGWLTDVIDTGRMVGTSNSLVVDDSDNLHVSYYDDALKDLKYAKK